MQPSYAALGRGLKEVSTSLAMLLMPTRAAYTTRQETLSVRRDQGQETTAPSSARLCNTIS